MTLLRTLDLAAAGMTAQRTRMNVAAMNLANKSTTRTDEGGPYRRRDVVLEAVPQDGFAGRLQVQMDTAGGDEPVQGVRVREIVQSDEAPMMIYDPGHPDADPNGYVAMPNVSGIGEMVNLLGAARAYEAGTTVMQTIRTMADHALRIGK